MRSRRRGIGLNEVEQAVGNANVNLPTGTLYGHHGHFGAGHRAAQQRAASRR